MQLTSRFGTTILVQGSVLIFREKTSFEAFVLVLFTRLLFQGLVVDDSSQVDLGARQVEILFNDLILDSNSILCFLLRILFLIGDEALISVLLLISIHSVSQLECIFSKLGSCYEVCASTLDYVSFVGGRSLL